MVPIKRMNELDNINANVQNLVNDAYQRGLQRGLAERKKAFDLLDAKCNTEYQRGLGDAWGVARKIVCDEGIDMNTLCTIFRRGCSDSIIRDYSASEAIKKIKEYEEQKDKEIKVGEDADINLGCRDCRF